MSVRLHEGSAFVGNNSRVGDNSRRSLIDLLSLRWSNKEELTTLESTYVYLKGSHWRLIGSKPPTGQNGQCAFRLNQTFRTKIASVWRQCLNRHRLTRNYVSLTPHLIANTQCPHLLYLFVERISICQK